LGDEMQAAGNGQVVNLLFWVAFAILLIGWINYINLATAQATDRAREIGVRKVVGARRSHLLGQFFVQSVVINGLAALVSLGLLTVLRQPLTNLLGHSLDFSLVSTSLLWTFGTVFLVGVLVSGVYPALLLSSIQPTSVLKGQLTQKLSGLWARRGLTVFQFAASILLIAGTFAVYRQVSFMQSQDLGFDAEQVLVLQGPKVGDNDNGQAFEPLRQQLLQLPDIETVCAAGTVPARSYNASLANVRPSGWADGTGLLLDFLIVDDQYRSTFGIDLIAGRDFSLQRDSSAQTVMVNEQAALRLGFNNPADIVGTNILWQSEDTPDAWFQVVGVIQDYHHASLQRARDAMVVVYDPYPDDYYALRMNTNNVATTIQKVKDIYTSAFPGNPFEHFFLDETFAAQYAADLRLGNIMILFGGLAIFIACLGLFGLASFTALRKMKEMGIRKILGASFASIIYLFTREFIGLIIVATVLGLPLAYWLIGRWLENYAYQMPLSVGLFLTPILLLLVISLLTISYHTVRTVLVNPINHLRQES
ncbi:MAG: FtsX-like permease family protein, partial [Bacteroidota bacterium]